MRTLLILLLASLLAACATRDDPSRTRQVDQTGNLKVHPGLLGLPVPAELQIPQTAVAREIETAPIETAPMRMDEEAPRSQRSVYFDLEKADLRADDTQIIAAHAAYLASNPAARVSIEGHADEPGNAGHNERLGLKRAQTVRAALVGHGAGQDQVSVKSWGNTRPKLQGRDEAARAENRRADIVYEQGK